MKTTTVVLVTAGIILASCSNNGNEATVKEAEKVIKEQTEVTSKYTSIADESYLSWRASHLGGVQPRYGKVYLKEVELLVNDKTLSNASVTVDLSSITVYNFGDDQESADKLRGHLMNADFFNVDTYPTAKFELTGISAKEGEYNSEVTGNLTILDATKSITFSANVLVDEDQVSIKSEDFSVDRTLWGLTYHVEGSEGVPVDYLIDDQVGFTIHLIVKK